MRRVESKLIPLPVDVVLFIIFCSDPQGLTFYLSPLFGLFIAVFVLFICLSDFLTSCLTHREMAVVLIKSPTKSTNKKNPMVFFCFCLCMTANLWLVPVRLLLNPVRLFKTDPLELLRYDPLQLVKTGRCEILCSDPLRLGLLNYFVTTLYDLRQPFELLRYDPTRLFNAEPFGIIRYHTSRLFKADHFEILRYDPLPPFKVEPLEPLSYDTF